MDIVTCLSHNQTVNPKVTPHWPFISSTWHKVGGLQMLVNLILSHDSRAPLSPSFSPFHNTPPFPLYNLSSAGFKGSPQIRCLSPTNIIQLIHHLPPHTQFWGEGQHSMSTKLASFNSFWTSAKLNLCFPKPVFSHSLCLLYSGPGELSLKSSLKKPQYRLWTVFCSVSVVVSSSLRWACHSLWGSDI